MVRFQRLELYIEKWLFDSAWMDRLMVLDHKRAGRVGKIVHVKEKVWIVEGILEHVDEQEFVQNISNFELWVDLHIYNFNFKIYFVLKNN